MAWVTRCQAVVRVDARAGVASLCGDDAPVTFYVHIDVVQPYLLFLCDAHNAMFLADPKFSVVGEDDPNFTKAIDS